MSDALRPARAPRMTEQHGNRDPAATRISDEAGLIRSSTPIPFSTARLACKQNDGRRGNGMTGIAPPALACTSKPDASATNKKPAEPSSRGLYQSPSPDKSSTNIFKTRKCYKNSLVGKKRRRRSSQKGHEDLSSLYCPLESTKFTNLIADLESTMQLLGPKVPVGFGNLQDSIFKNASLPFFQMSFLHQNRQAQIPDSDCGEADPVAHNDALQAFASDAIKQISRLKKSLSFRAKRRELKAKLFGNPFNVRSEVKNVAR